MFAFVVRRVLSLMPILLGVSVMVFAIIHVTPGDPIRLALGAQATPESIITLRHERGLDDSLPAQYVHYLGRLLHGDLGTSIRGQSPVADDITTRLPSTLQLAGSALLVAAIVGLTVGAIAATTKRRWLDTILTVSTISALSVPLFWVSMVAITVFSVHLDWVPAVGGSGFTSLILPALILSIAPTAIIAQLTRASMLAVAQEDHVRAARASGLPQRRVIRRYVLRNALVPVVTVGGLLASDLLTGAVFVEVVFSRSGLGSYAVTAVHNRDFPQVQGIVMFAATVFVLVNLLTDVTYGLLDPRIRLVGAARS